VVWPREQTDLRRFVQRFTIRHAHSWHVRNGSVGRGHLYQGRYKSCLVDEDRYLLTVCRYVERNPVRALLVDRAEAWPWSSASSRRYRDDAGAASRPFIRLEPMRVETPGDWLRWVNEPQTDAELYRLRLHVRSGSPLFTPEAEEADEADDGQSRIASTLIPRRRTEALAYARRVQSRRMGARKSILCDAE
jgi:putative transposase